MIGTALNFPFFTKKSEEAIIANNNRMRTGRYEKTKNSRVSSSEKYDNIGISDKFI